MTSYYNRAVLESVLIFHQKRLGPPPHSFTCHCGWGLRPEHLGKSHAAHIADVYEQAVGYQGAVVQASWEFHIKADKDDLR